MTRMNVIYKKISNNEQITSFQTLEEISEFTNRIIKLTSTYMDIDIFVDYMDIDICVDYIDMDIDIDIDIDIIIPYYPPYGL